MILLLRFSEVFNGIVNCGDLFKIEASLKDIWRQWFVVLFLPEVDSFPLLINKKFEKSLVFQSKIFSCETRMPTEALN